MSTQNIKRTSFYIYTGIEDNYHYSRSGKRSGPLKTVKFRCWLPELDSVSYEDGETNTASYWHSRTELQENTMLDLCELFKDFFPTKRQGFKEPDEFGSVIDNCDYGTTHYLALRSRSFTDVCSIVRERLLKAGSKESTEDPDAVNPPFEQEVFDEFMRDAGNFDVMP